MNMDAYMQELRGSSNQRPSIPVSYENGSLVKFSSYYDPYMGDYTSSSIAGGMIGTLKGEDSQRANHYIVHLGDNTPVSVPKHYISPLENK
jgi:hypothetical protein